MVEPDDDSFHDFPPAAHPAREMVGMGCAALIVLGALIWILWKLI